MRVGNDFTKSEMSKKLTFISMDENGLNKKKNKGKCQLNEMK